MLKWVYLKGNSLVITSYKNLEGQLQVFFMLINNIYNLLTVKLLTSS